MSVMKALIIVIPMLIAPTLLGASPVPVTKDTVEMEQLVMVSYYAYLDNKLTLMYMQTLMSAWLIIVIPMQTVLTLLGASPVPVTKDTLEMEELVMVSYYTCIDNKSSIEAQMLMSVSLIIIVIPTLTVPTLLEASPVPVTKATLEMEGLVMVSYYTCIDNKSNIEAHT